jgi:hypothetical protein
VGYQQLPCQVQHAAHWQSSLLQLQLLLACLALEQQQEQMACCWPCPGLETTAALVAGPAILTGWQVVPRLSLLQAAAAAVRGLQAPSHRP